MTMGTQDPPAYDDHQDYSDNTEHKKKDRTCCKKVLKAVFSHIGLSSIVIVYSIIGGLIFEHLEATNEKEECVQAMEKYAPMANKTLLNIWLIAQAYGTEYLADPLTQARTESGALDEFEKILKEFRSDVIELGYDGKNCTIMGETGGPGYQWSFAGSTLFAVTVITTVGAYLIVGWPATQKINFNGTLQSMNFYCGMYCAQAGNRTRVSGSKGENHTTITSTLLWLHTRFLGELPYTTYL